MYVFGGWVPVPESDEDNASGTEWICSDSLSVLNLGQYISLKISHTPIRVFTQGEGALEGIFIGSVLIQPRSEASKFTAALFFLSQTL